jgi:signal transduction histidine kinase
MLFEQTALIDQEVLKSREIWSIRFRWIAVLGFFAISLVAKYVFLLELPYVRIWLLLVFLSLINFAYLLLSRLLKNSSISLSLKLIVFRIIIDLFILTILIHFSGGIETPLFIFYLFHIVRSSILFSKAIPYIIASYSVLLFSGLVLLEHYKIISHICVFTEDIHNNQPYLYLSIIIFAITAYFITYIVQNFVERYREIKIKIDQQNTALKSLDDEKTKFFRFASHELKSPVATIQSSIDSVLANFNLDEKAKNMLSKASGRANFVLKTITELLELSRTNKYHSEKKYELINFIHLIEAIHEENNAQAVEKNIKVKLSLPKIPLFLEAEYDDLKKIFTNLFSNAIRYSHENSEVSVDVTKINNEIVFSIEDQGIGIKKSDLKLVFTEFYRSENAKKHMKFGTGLGLSLVKSLIEKYGGKISVKSEENVGTTFLVKLPEKNIDEEF